MKSHLGLTVTFTVTIFVSALLLFGVQPMVGKMLLPMLGGTPAVWNLCMVFFQAVLLFGYGYAHLVARRGNPLIRVFHLFVIGAALFVLPIAVSSEGLPTDSDPSLWLLGTLVAAVGLPFFALSTTSPLLQSWMAQTDHPKADDPYFLYAASNAGSVLALLGYPLLIERIADVPAQAEGWRWGYVLFVGLIAVCAVVMGKGRDLAGPDASGGGEAPSWRTRAYWLALAAVPSSLMLGVTTYITTDIASFPLVWVIPLAIYLVSFIIVFGRSSWRPPVWLGRAMCLVGLALTVALILGANHPAWLLVTLHLLMFAVACLVLHGELAAHRPSARYLTEFFFIMSLGGVIGGAFNALLAPLIFTRIWEYPVAIMIACSLRRLPEEGEPPSSKLRKAVPALVPVVAFAAFGVAKAFELEFDQVGVLMVFGPPALLAYSLVEWPKRFAAGGLALIAAGAFFSGVYGETHYEERNFFGVVRVTEMTGLDGRKFNALVHGNTVHGRVDLKLYEDECVPLAYFYRTGPAAGIFKAFHKLNTPPRIGLIGLGVGSLACYGEPGEKWTYFELDPEVVHVAAETDYFRLLAQSKADINYVLGDARIQLQRWEGEPFGMVLLDAFSSDAIPVHLITKEAFQVYVDRLAPGGVIAAHISNRYLDLVPVIGSLAEALNLEVRLADNTTITASDAVAGKEPSRWVLLWRKGEKGPDLPPVWRVVDERVPEVWTDAYSDVLSTWQ